MTAPSVFGSILNPGMVEDAVTDLLKLWMPTYLREAERITNRTGTLPNIQTWSLESAEDRRVGQDITPGLFVECASCDLEERSDRYAGSFPMTVAVVTRSERKYAHARKLAQTYSTMVALILGQQDLPLGEVTLTGLAVGLETAETRRYLARGDVTGSIYVESILRTAAGPSAPAPDPDSPPGLYPTAEHVVVHVNDSTTVTRP